MIILNKISKTYKSKSKVMTKALDNVSFTLPDKGLYFILGKSGSGKSTLLNIIGGLDKYDSGEILIDGKSSKKFKNKDYDYYRNTYIGFIFQEFNLLDDYNVYDNIMLSKKIQKKKISKLEIDNLLNLVGLNNLGKRKINELSGGQKQRVAIARALIKDPKIILADEPTGSLDLETGREIFDLLKNISMEKLIIVVSHDRESAIKYADGIIEISDGRIISNNTSIIFDNNQKFKTIKSKLPLLSSIRLALLNINTKKIKLIFTCLLITMSLIFFGISKVLSYFDIEDSYAKTMVDTNEEYIDIIKTAYNEYQSGWYNDYMVHKLNDADINKINKSINSNSYYKYKLVEDNSYIGLEINFKDTFRDNDRSAYFTYIPSNTNFEYLETNETFLNKKILGKYPENYDEILIHNYLADYIIHSGVALYDNTNSYKIEYYKPASYEEIITDGKYLKLGSTKVKITGILLDNIDKYNELKKITYEEISHNQKESWLGLVGSNSLYSEMSSRIQPTLVYVKEGFGNNIRLKPNTTVDRDYYEGKIINSNKTYYIDNIYSYLNDKITIYNGDKDITLSKLNDNEIIINESYLDILSDKNYSKLKDDYLKDYHDKEKKAIEDNKKIQDNNKKLLEDYNKKIESSEETEEPKFLEEVNFKYKSDEELTHEFITNYLKENNVINSTINIKFVKGTLNNDDITDKEYNDIKVIGIQLNDSNSLYISNNIAKDIMRDNSFISAIRVKSNSRDEIKKIFVEYPIDNNKYISKTAYSDTILGVSNILEGLSNFCFYISIVFGIFAVILLTNFIVSSITYNRKVIGILRALGTRKIDIFKIYLNEGIILGILSLFLSVFILKIGIIYMNSYISSFLFYHIDFISLSANNILLLILSVFTVIIASSLFSVRKIAKMNPVDAILNK